MTFTEVLELIDQLMIDPEKFKDDLIELEYKKEQMQKIYLVNGTKTLQ